MPPRITFQLISVATCSDDREGVLVLAAGELVAVLVRLADEAHDDVVRGSWYLEAGFGPIENRRGSLFDSLEQAGDAIADQVGGIR